MKKQSKKKKYATITSLSAITAVSVAGVLPVFETKVSEAYDQYFAGGNGTSENPYILTNPQQLSYMRFVPTSHFQLANDIILTTNWQIIEGFSGSLDGNGYSIKNLKLQGFSTNYIGFFDEIDGAYIHDLTFENPIVSTTGDYTGVVAGAVRESIIENVHVKNGNVTGTNATGGLVGEAKGSNMSMITDSSFQGNVTGTAGIGGILGDATTNLATAVTLKSVLVDGTISGTGTKVGGIAGQISGITSSISDTFAKGEVKSTNYNVGGIVGNLAHRSSIYNAIAINSVSGTYNVGGIAGKASSDDSFITYVYAYNQSITATTTSSTNKKNIGYIIGRTADTPLTANNYITELSNVPIDLNRIIRTVTTAQTKSKNMYLTLDTNGDGLQFGQYSPSRPAVWGIVDGLSLPFLLIEGAKAYSNNSGTTVTIPNTAPTKNGQIPEQTVREDATPITVNLANYFKDAENDVLTYEVKSVSNANASATIEGSVIEITPNSVGPTNITVVATDTSGLSVEQTFTVNVTQAVLTPPVVKKVENVQAAFYNNVVHITWDEFEGATRYLLQTYVYDETSGEFIKDGFLRSTTSATLTLNILPESSKYRFEVIPFMNQMLPESSGVSSILNALPN